MATTLLKPRLKLSHNVVRSDDGDLAIGEVGGCSYFVRNPPPALLELLLLLDGTRTLPRLKRDFARRQYAEQVSVEQVLEALHEACLLDDGAIGTDQLTQYEVERYDRQLIQFSCVEKQRKPGLVYQERLKAARVCVLGMGGWGTWVSLNLALAGVGALRVIDNDLVELSNLNRQVLYDNTSIGFPKVEAARTALARINPNVAVEPISEFVEPDEQQIERLLQGVTAIVLCWANQSHFVQGTAEELVHKYGFRNRIPLIEIAGDPFDISVGPTYLNDGCSPCLRCVRPQVQAQWWPRDDALLTKFRKANVRCTHARQVNAWQSAPSLSVVSGLVVDELIKILTGYSPPLLVGSRFSLSLQHLTPMTEGFAKRIDCEWCGTPALR